MALIEMNFKRLFPRRRTGEGAIDGIVGIGVLAALEKGELTCEAVRKALVGYGYGSLALVEEGRG